LEEKKILIIFVLWEILMLSTSSEMGCHKCVGVSVQLLVICY